jgi:hypothetical protein
MRLAAVHSHDRAAYSRGKSEFITRVTSLARELSALEAGGMCKTP